MSLVIREKIKQRKPRAKRARKGPQKARVTRTKVVVQQRKRPRKNRNGRGRSGFKNQSYPGTRDGSIKMGTIGTSNAPSVEEGHELITGITNQSASAFAIANTFALNPGLAATFPRLSIIAKVWERYEFDYLRFEYRPTVNEFNTDGTTGVVMLAVDVDPGDGSPPTKPALYDMPQGLISSSLPCRGNMIRHIPKQILFPKKVPKLVRTGTPPVNASIDDYDCGNLFVATAGTTNNTNALGKLHVFYRVRFTIPTLGNENVVANTTATFLQTTTAEAATNTVQQTVLFATATTNGLAVVNTAGSMVPQSGNYIVSGQVSVFNSSAAVNTGFLADVFKNGVSVFTSTGKLGGGHSEGVSESGITTLPFTFWTSANGTDAYTVKVTPFGASGTLTVAGQIIWHVA